MNDNVRTYRSLFIVFAIVSLISCFIMRSFYGILLASVIMVFIIGFLQILSFLYFMASKISILFKNTNYIVFKELDFNKRYNVVNSTSFILGITLILIFLNLNYNLTDIDSRYFGKTRNIVLNIDINEEYKTESFLSNRKQEYEKYYTNTGEIVSINGKKIGNIISDRFESNHELSKNHKDYAKNISISEVECKNHTSILMGSLRPNKINERKIFVNTDIFNMIHKFKVNDVIELRIGEKNIKYTVSKVLDKSQRSISDSFFCCTV